MHGVFKVITLRGVSLRVHVGALLIMLPCLAYLGHQALFPLVPRLADIPPERLAGGPMVSLFVWSPWAAVSLLLADLVHELAHTFYALRKGGQVADITLPFFLPLSLRPRLSEARAGRFRSSVLILLSGNTLKLTGGGSRITRMPEGHRQEAWVLLAGPVANLVLGGLCLGVFALLAGVPSYNLPFAIFYLGLINLLFGLYNLLPSFPMDGGRILRALLTGKLGRLRATRVAGRFGKGFAVLLGGLGSFIFFSRLAVAVDSAEFPDAVAVLPFFYLAPIVFSMYAGANLAMRVEIPRSLLEKVRVRELMVRHTGAVAAGDTLEQVAEHMRLDRRQALPVVEQGQIVGLVTLEVMRRIPVAERARRRVREVVRPVPAVTPEASAWDALLEMGQYGVLQLPVVEEGVLVGTVSEEDVARELKLRELGEPLASGTRRHPVLAEPVLPTDVTPALTFELATPRGISLRVHAFFRWLLGLWVLAVLPFYAFLRSFPGATDPADDARLSVWGLGLWGLGGLVALVLTGLAHELGHVFYALRKGGQVSEITLLMVGGVSRITGLPGGLKQEVSMALAGLATSLMMGVLFIGVGGLLPGGASFNPSLAFVGLGLFNLFVGFWNLLPSFPLDGGRLLRALLTGKLGRSRATRVVGWLGKGLAVLLAVGLFSFVFPLVLALSLYAGSKRETRALWMEPLLARVRARELMVRLTGAVAAEDTLEQVAERMRLERRQALPVMEQGQVVGLVTLEAVRRISVAERARRRVREVARRVPAVTPEASAWDALLEMGQYGVPQLPVVEEGMLVGTLSGEEVERELKLRELRAPRGFGPQRLVLRESPT